ncbi:hypothetical protein PUN28_017915 [Cardiocondyla obscurior]|uniref:Uncharacterized protein n=1 Tax=Cardiocondyla obscurior TaxID=286306 RepID=A0AAW2EKM9_9HYME
MCVRNVDVHVSCSSQVDAQLAAFFIDPRAKGSARARLRSLLLTDPDPRAGAHIDAPSRSSWIRTTRPTGRASPATGGVYKGQGRNQRELMTRAYWEFLVHGEQFHSVSRHRLVAMLCLIVPNRAAGRSATHGLTHGGIWAKPAKFRRLEDLAAASVLFYGSEVRTDHTKFLRQVFTNSFAIRPRNDRRELGAHLAESKSASLVLLSARSYFRAVRPSKFASLVLLSERSYFRAVRSAKYASLVLLYLVVTSERSDRQSTRASCCFRLGLLSSGSDNKVREPCVATARGCFRTFRAINFFLVLLSARSYFRAVRTTKSASPVLLLLGAASELREPRVAFGSELLPRGPSDKVRDSLLAIVYVLKSRYASLVLLSARSYFRAVLAAKYASLVLLSARSYFRAVLAAKYASLVLLSARLLPRGPIGKVREPRVATARGCFRTFRANNLSFSVMFF